MRNTDQTRAALRYLLDWVLDEKLPEGAHFDVFDDGMLTFQCPSQEAVRACRAVFPGIFWEKHWSASCQWWEYKGTTDAGVKLWIYAVREAPPTCRAIETEEEVEEQVPVKFETRIVKRKRLTWDCGPEVTP